MRAALKILIFGTYFSCTHCPLRSSIQPAKTTGDGRPEPFMASCEALRIPATWTRCELHAPRPLSCSMVESGGCLRTGVLLGARIC